MRDIHDRELALKQVPFLLRDFIRNIFIDSNLRLERVLSISESHADKLRQAPPKELSYICEVAAQKGAVTIAIDSQKLKKLDLSKPCKPFSYAFRWLAINAFDTASCFINTYSYVNRDIGMLCESWFQFDDAAVDIMSNPMSRESDAVATRAFIEKALIVDIDGGLLSVAIDQHFRYQKSQSRIDHLVLSNAPTAMIRYLYPGESDKDVTRRRERLNVHLRGRPVRPTITQEIEIYRLLHVFNGLSDYQLVVRIAEELELDYSELWVVLSQHWERDDGDKIYLLERPKYRNELAKLPDDEKAFSIAGLLGCSESQAYDYYALNKNFFAPQ